MWKLVGLKLNSFTDKSTGQLVEGYRCYFARQISDHEGVETRSDFINKAKLESFDISLKLGNKYFIADNRYGKIDSMMEVK